LRRRPVPLAAPALALAAAAAAAFVLADARAPADEALRLAQRLVYTCQTERGSCPLTYPQVEGSSCRCAIDGQWVAGTAR
jgi:hypothetical protein